MVDLEGATSGRRLGEAGMIPGVNVRKLIFGIPNATIVNAAFTHAGPRGNRFNGPNRGVWHAAFQRRTQELEVSYPRGRELQEVN